MDLQDQDLSVAMGGVFYHYSIHNGAKLDRILNDSIGIETSNQYVEHLAKAGVSLPYKSRVFNEFAVSKDGTNRIDIPFYLGNRNDTLPPNRKIADRSIKFDKSLKEGDSVSIQLEVDSAGILITRIWINNDEKNRSIMEIDSKVIEEDNLTILQNNEINIKLNKYKKIDKVHVDNDENIVKFVIGVEVLIVLIILRLII